MTFALLKNYNNKDTLQSNWEYVKNVFCNFNKEKIKNTNNTYFVEKLKSKSLVADGWYIYKLMKGLKYNIGIFEKIEENFDSIDDFIFKKDILLFISSYSEYNLQQIEKVRIHISI